MSCNAQKNNVSSDTLPLPYNGYEVVKNGAILKNVLNENSLVEMETYNEVVLDSIHDGFAFLRIYIVLNQKQFTDKVVKEGTTLVSEKQRILGSALTDIEIHPFIENKYSSYYSGYFECVTEIKNFYHESIIENRVNDIVTKKGDSLDHFNDLIEISDLNIIDSSDFIDFLEDDEFARCLTELSELPDWNDLKVYYSGVGGENYTFDIMLVFERNQLVSSSSPREFYVPNWVEVQTFDRKHHISINPSLIKKEAEQKKELTQWLLRNL